MNITDIKIREGFNPRETYDHHAIDELAASIRRHGVIQPVIVNPDGEVIDGHRRVIAAAAAGLAEVPTIVQESGQELEIAIVANLQREDLDPYTEAKALKRLKDTGIKGGAKGLAEAVGKSTDWVKGRLRLLDMPQEIAQKIAAGEMPLRGAEILAPLAKMSETAAILVARMMTSPLRESYDVEWDDVAEDLLWALHVAERDIDWEGLEERDFLIIGGYGSGVPQGVVELLNEQTKEAIEQLPENVRYQAWGVHFPEVIDAARASGSLFEIEDSKMIVSREAINEAIRMSAELAARRLAERPARASSEAASSEPEPEEALTKEQWEARQKAERERKKAEREQTAQAKVDAHLANLRLGGKLMEHADKQKKIDLDDAKLVARVVMATDPFEAAVEAGWKWLDERLQFDEETHGGKRKTRRYTTAEGEPLPVEKAREWVLRGKTPPQVIHRLIVVLVSPYAANQTPGTNAERWPHKPFAIEPYSSQRGLGLELLERVKSHAKSAGIEL